MIDRIISHPTLAKRTKAIKKIIVFSHTKFIYTPPISHKSHLPVKIQYNIHFDIIHLRDHGETKNLLHETAISV